MIWTGSPLGFDVETGRPISHDGNEPTLIVGPMGVYKTVGQAAVELLNDEGKRSFFVWDPSLELAAICANWRRKVCGRENVYFMNSYGVLSNTRPDLSSSKWNPLREVPANSPKLSDICGAIGDAVVPTSSNETQKHFVDAARSGVSGMTKAEILEAAATPGAVPSLPNVRARLTQDAVKLRATVKSILEKNPKDFDLRTRLSRYLGEETGEKESVRANIESATAWMSDALCADMVTNAGVCFRTMRDRPTTIFCGTPPEEEKPAYMRLVLSLVLRALYREDGVPATLLIDEAYVLGRHEEIIKALSILRKYNCRMTLVYQSIAQAEEHFPKTWGMLTSGAVMAFRAADEEGARWMSFRGGEEVVPSPSYADPSSPNDLGVKPSWSPLLRERIRAGKMFSMPVNKALVWLPGDEKPRVSHVKGYFEIPELAARASVNPYYTPKAAAASKASPAPSAGRPRRSVTVAVIAAGAVAAGVTLWPSAGPSLVEQSAAVTSIPNRPELGEHHAAPRKPRHHARRPVTPAQRGFQ
jgi:type IV secretory pathway TraG/TraD family ATPase VirD4